MDRRAHEQANERLLVNGKTLTQIAEENEKLEQRSIDIQREFLLHAAISILKTYSDGNGDPASNTSGITKNGTNGVQIADASIRAMTSNVLSGIDAGLDDRKKNLEEFLATVMQTVMKTFHADFSVEMGQMYTKQKGVMNQISKDIKEMVNAFTGVLTTLRLKVEVLERTLSANTAEVAALRLQMLQMSLYPGPVKRKPVKKENGEEEEEDCPSPAEIASPFANDNGISDFPSIGEILAGRNQ